MNPSVAIIGAGITGLTAAYRLSQQGVPFSIYESSSRTGGVIHTSERDGYLAEHGPNTLLETSPIIRTLLTELDLGLEQIYSNPEAEKRFLVRNHRLQALPSSLLGWATTPLFSFPAKIRVLGDFLLPRAPSDLEETLAAFVVRRMGQEFLDYAINPFVAGIYAGEPERLSLREAFPKLHAIEQRYRSLFLGQLIGARERRKTGEISKSNAPKLSFRHGLGSLTQALTRQVADSLHTSTPVTRICRQGEIWTVTIQKGESTETHEHSAILLAAPAYRLAEIDWNTGDGQSLRWLGDIVYTPVTSLGLGFRRSEVAHPLDGFGVLVPAVEKIPILGAIFSSSLFPNRAPTDHVLLTCYLGGSRDPKLAQAAAETQIETTLKALRQLLGVTGQPTFIHRTAYSRAIPQYEIGFGKFRERMATLEASNAGLHLAGHFRDGISLSDSLLAGHDAATKLIQHGQRSNKTHFSLASQTIN